MAESNNPFKDLKALDGVTDVRKLISKVTFPVYTLDYPSFQPYRISPVFSSFGEAQRRTYSGFYEVSLSFCSPNRKQCSRVVVITSRMRRPWHKEPSAIEETLLFQVRANREHMPAGFEMPFSVSDSDLENAHEFIKTIAWQTRVASGLEFHFIHWDTPSYFSLGFSKLGNGLIVVESAGVPKSDFLKIIDGLLPLQKSEELIDTFQEELRVQRKEREQEIGDP